MKVHNKPVQEPPEAGSALSLAITIRELLRMYKVSDELKHRIAHRLTKEVKPI